LGTSISTKRLNDLNQGLCSTANLNEWLAVDHAKLLNSVSQKPSFRYLADVAKRLPKVSVPKQLAWIGSQISELKNGELLQNHPSDVVRSWVCYAFAAKANEIEDALEVVKPFAGDVHFGVREIAWMSVREKICEYPNEAIKILLPWTKDSNENIRRFASEATRPRGVWAKHIDQFKKDPEPGRPLLDRLFKDDSRYVQNSVANWLNDAAKSSPKWVKSLCADWQEKSASKATIYIVKRAQRSMKEKL